MTKPNFQLRARLIEALQDAPADAQQLAQRLGYKSKEGVECTLKAMERAGIVKRRRASPERPALWRACGGAL